VTEFTPHQATVWAAALSCFPVEIVNESILEFSLSADPFPDMGKIVMACQRIERSRSNDYAPCRNDERPGRKLVAAMAEALSMKIAE